MMPESFTSGDIKKKESKHTARLHARRIAVEFHQCEVYSRPVPRLAAFEH